LEEDQMLSAPILRPIVPSWIDTGARPKMESGRDEHLLRVAIADPLRCWTIVLLLEGRPGPFRDDLRFVAQRVPWFREIPRWPSVFGRLRRCGQSALTLAEESLARHLYRQIDKGGHERRLDAGLYNPEGRPMC
jgi:hypothetical protein